MSRNSGGTYSLPTGNPVVNGTTIDPTVHNNTLSDIASELTNSLDRGGRGAMTAPLPVVSGSAGAPGISFDGDADTGMYRIGANNIGLACSGAKVVDVASGTVGVTGAVTASNGLTVTRSSSNTDAVTATGNGTGKAAVLAAGTASTGAAQTTAAELTNGNLKLSGTAPNKTVALANTLTPLNIPKCWGRVVSGGSPTVTDGFSVTSVAVNSTNYLRVTMAQAMADTNYAVICSMMTPGSQAGNSFQVSACNLTTTTFDLAPVLSSTLAAPDLTSTTTVFAFMVFGRQ